MLNTCIEIIKIVVCFKYGSNSSELVHSKQYKVYALFITLSKRDSWMLHLKRGKTSTIPSVQTNRFLILLDDVVRTSVRNICYR
jgi:hypothetical protein